MLKCAYTVPALDSGDLMTARTGEVQAVARITSVDILRGVAVLAIIVANLPFFAEGLAAQINPNAYGELRGLDWWIWLLTYILVSGRFTAIFAMLFGASIVILAERRASAGLPVARLHYRRMAALAVLGLLHAYLIWWGDFLLALAICGALVFSYRGLAPRRLLAFGSAVVMVAPVISIGLGASMQWWTPAAEVSDDPYWSPSPATIAAEIAAYRGGWRDQMAHRVPTAYFMETAHLGSRLIWQLGGLMIAGMGLYKLGVFSAIRSGRFYAALAAVGFGLGVPQILMAVAWGYRHHWQARDFLLVGEPLSYLGGLFVGLGWIGLVMLLCQRTRCLAPLAAVGRMALTNYLLQSLICTSIFYGHGLGQFGRIDRAGQLAIAAGVCVIQLAVSSWWFTKFSVGPIEWAWRSAALGRRLSLRR
jgi:uncharacterized protein